MKGHSDYPTTEDGRLKLGNQDLEQIADAIRRTQRQARTEGGERGSFHEKETALSHIMDMVEKYATDRRIP